MEQALITIPPQTALQVFTTDSAIDPFLSRVRAEIDAFSADVKTSKGRRDIASMAYRIAQTKTSLESVGKALADEQKLIPKKIDASRKLIRDTLDGWRDEVRQPLTEWEMAEEARVARHTAAIEGMASAGAILTTAEDIRAQIARVEAVTIGPECEEFEAAYARAKDTAIRDLRARLSERERYEAEQIELAKLRREAEERAEREHEERIRAEAAANAKREAETAALAEAARVEARIRADQQAAEHRELQLKLAAEAAEKRAAEAELRAKREAEAEKARVAAEAEKREANTRYRAKVNREAVAAMVAGGINEETARAVVVLIAKKVIPRITISY